MAIKPEDVVQAMTGPLFDWARDKLAQAGEEPDLDTQARMVAGIKME